VHHKAFTGCLPMGCCHCENKEGLHCCGKDDESGNAQLCTSCSNDGRRQMSESSPCCHGVPPVSHPDGCELVKNAVKVSMPLVMVVTRLLSMTMPLWDVWQMVVIIMALVFSHLYIKVISLAMHNCVNHLLMITNIECWGCHLVPQWLREPSKSMQQGGESSSNSRNQCIC